MLYIDKTPELRILPSTLDILFALGNDASAQLLKNELDIYGYSPNLAALRYLLIVTNSSFGIIQFIIYG